jgi:hypothetical protein
VDAHRPSATTLKELLAELKSGFPLHAPVLIRVQDAPGDGHEGTVERTMTSQHPLDWAHHYTREYGNEPFLVLMPGTGGAGPVTIGRSRTCDVKIESESVSKLHARLEPDAGNTYYIVDESSRNGTCINGQPLVAGVRMAVWPGAYVAFGDTVYVFIDPPNLDKLSRLTG